MQYFLCAIGLLCSIAILGGLFTRRGRIEDRRERQLPIDGQSALDCSVRVDKAGRSLIRVGISCGQIVELNLTLVGESHGYVVDWNAAKQSTREALIREGWYTARGKLL